MRHLRRRDGFTLVELMIVVVIIGILAAMAIPRFNNASARAKEKEADNILGQIYRLQETYKAYAGSWATALTGSPSLVDVGYEPSTSLKNYNAPTGGPFPAPYQMQPKTTNGKHRCRQVDSTGDISYC